MALIRPSLRATLTLVLGLALPANAGAPVPGRDQASAAVQRVVRAPALFEPRVEFVLVPPHKRNSVDTTKKGSVGGKVRKRAEWYKTGLGWRRFNYTNYATAITNEFANAGELITGVLRDEFTLNDKLTEPSGGAFALTRTFSNLTVTSGGVTRTYQGTLRYSYAGDDLVLIRLVADLTVTEQPSGRVTVFQGFTVDSYHLLAGYPWLHSAIGGTLVDATLGPLVTATPGSFGYPGVETGVAATGVMTVTVGGATVTMRPLNRSLRTLSLDSGGVEYSGALDLGATLGTGGTDPQPRAGGDYMAGAGQPFQLPGPGSFDPDGSLLTHSWDLVFAPPGAQATLTGTSTAHPTFTGDLEGQYLLRLTVNDGTTSRMDTVRISVGGGASNYFADPGADFHATVGATVTLDGRSSSADPTILAVANPSHVWEMVMKPAGSTATLSGANTDRPSFVADLPGLYAAQLQYGGFSGYGTVRVAVGVPLDFENGLYLGQLSLQARADVDGDPRDDLVAAGGSGSQGSASRIRVLRGTGSHGLGALVEHTIGEGSHPTVGDVDGDGRYDLLGTTAHATLVSFQQADGSFAAPVSIADPSDDCGWDSTSSAERFAAAADLDGDGVRTVLALSHCRTALFAFEPDGAGGFTPRAGLEFPDDRRTLGPPLVVDLDGDGAEELLFAFPGESIPFGSLPETVWRVSEDGAGALQFEALVMPLSCYGCDVSLAIGDVDGDGRLDLVAASADTALVWFQDAAGFVDDPVVLDGGGNAHTDTIAVGDADGDGHAEVYWWASFDPSSLISPKVKRWRFDAARQQSEPEDLPFHRGFSFDSATLGDYNGDGLLDATEGTTIYLGRPDWTP